MANVTVSIGAVPPSEDPGEELGWDRCCFCDRWNVVPLFGRKRPRCKCGARFFRRLVYDSCHKTAIAETEGWKRGDEEWHHC